MPFSLLDMQIEYKENRDIQKIREAERNKDFLKNKLYFLEEKATSLRASYQNYEDLLEELKFRVLEMELAR